MPDATMGIFQKTPDHIPTLPSASPRNAVHAIIAYSIHHVRHNTDHSLPSRWEKSAPQGTERVQRLSQYLFSLFEISRCTWNPSSLFPFTPPPFLKLSSKFNSRRGCLPCSTTAVQEAQVAVPANANHIDKQDAVVQRHKGEVDSLHKRPDHPVSRQGGLVVLVELLLDGTTLEHGHAAQEAADSDGGKDTLVEGDARGGGGFG